MTTALTLYAHQVAGKATNPIDIEVPCPKGGSAHVTGTGAALPDGTPSLDLAYTFKACASADRDSALTFDGIVQVKGTFSNSTVDGFSDFTFSSPSLSIAGKVLINDVPSVNLSCPASVYLRSSVQEPRQPYGTLCGRAFGAAPAQGTGGAGGSGGTGTGGTGGSSGDPCAPYSGSYAGIYAFNWSCVNDPSQNGTGTINVHFTAQCAYTKPDGTLWLEVKSVMSDNPHLGSLTQESCPVDCGYLAMPPNPPTTSGPEHGIYLVFPNLAILSSEGAFTVTSGALKIGSDVPNKAAFIVGDPAFSAAGKPDGCVVDTRTFKIDKTSL
ncbi:MAG: hypothetical protein IPM35_28790 [Myxococcales bacterium]|nr:hypothetical protein [Myxococcales bacterium]